MSAEAAVWTAIQQSVDRGDYRQAIASLTAENRRAASVAVERRLVELRHVGSGAPPAAQGASPWPPPFADPFPETVGVPEIAAAHLTAAIIGGALLHHGSLLVRGLVSLDRATLLARDIDRAFAAYDAAGAARSPTRTRAGSPRSSRATGRRTARSSGSGSAPLGGLLLADSLRGLFDVTEPGRRSAWGACLRDIWASGRRCRSRSAPCAARRRTLRRSGIRTARS